MAKSDAVLPNWFFLFAPFAHTPQTTFRESLSKAREALQLFLLLLIFGCASAVAQDSGAIAAQQAMQAAQQANQQAIDAAQLANQQAMEATQQAMQNMQNATSTVAPAYLYTAAPTFSVKAGKVSAGTTVRLKSRTHYAVIYYTTNGWTPTTYSRRYTGPIPINASTELQAIAVAPNFGRSPVATAKYTVQGSAAAVQPKPVATDGVLHAGTRLHLVTDATVSSKTAQVGDTLKLLLDQDVEVGSNVVVPKGTPVEATITQADPAGHVGTPGDVAFEVHSLTVNGTKIPLAGGESLEGENHYARTEGLLLIPVVGVAALATRGDEAQIKPGMSLTAAVAADTPLPR